MHVDIVIASLLLRRACGVVVSVLRDRARALSGVAVLQLVALVSATQAHAAATLPAGRDPQGHYIFRGYGPADGLVNTAVNQLAQGPQGFIWVGTDDVLYRYDGTRFDVFGTEQGLPSVTIDALHVDGGGTLWVGTRGGLARWNGVGFESLRDALAPTDIVHGIADDAEHLWLATSSGLSVAARDLHFRAAPGWPGGEATALASGRTAKGMWVGRWNGEAQVLRYDGSWHAYAFDTPATERIDTFAEDGAGRLWARSISQLWRLDAAGQHFEHVATPVPLNGNARGYLAQGRRGDLWISGADLTLHREGERWSETLGGAVLGTRPVLEDREGTMWFGARGLQRLTGRGIFRAYDIAEGLPGNVAWSVARDHEQTLWVGTEHGLAGVVGSHFAVVPGTEHYTIRSIAIAPDGKMYLGGAPAHDMLIYDPVHRTVRHALLRVAKDPERIYHLQLDDEGVLWATTDSAGLLRTDTREPELHFVAETLPGSTPDESFRGIGADQAGRLWVAGHNGLLVREHARWRRLTTADGLLANQVNYVRPTRNGDLLVVYDGTLGFDRMRYVGGTLRTLRHVAAGSSRYIDEIFLVGEDANDNVWVGTGRGVDFYSAAGTEHFSSQQGLVGEDTASMSFLADPNGDVWFGVVGGLVRFDAARYAALPRRTAPPAALVEARLGEQHLAPSTARLQVPHTANSFQVRFASPSFVGDSLLQYKTRLDGLETTATIGESREARYSALPPGSYRFEVSARYGAQGEWGAPATFEFQVLPAWWQAWWARTLLALALVIAVVRAVRWRVDALQARNRLLETNIWARTKELTQSNLLLVSEIGDRIRAESAVQQRNAELEEANRRLAGTQSQLLQSEKMASVGQLAAGVAHEINNPIGFVHSNLNSLTRYVEEIFTVLRSYERLESALPPDDPKLEQLRALKRDIDLDFLRSDTDDLLTETMDGVTRVQKIVKDLKEFSHVDEAEWQRIDLHHSIDSTLNVVAHELKYKAELIRQYGALPPIECLPFQINQVFLNLLVNAVQAIAERGTITIRTGHDGDFVWASITDSGKGIEPAVLHRIFEPFFTTKPVGVGTGLGLSVSYGIVQKHGGTIEVESTVGRGTTFTVRLPIEGRRAAAAERAEPARENAG